MMIFSALAICCWSPFCAVWWMQKSRSSRRESLSGRSKLAGGLEGAILHRLVASVLCQGRSGSKALASLPPMAAKSNGAVRGS